MRKFVLVSILVIFLGATTSTRAQGSSSHSLSSVVLDFYEAWLGNRNVSKASSFIASSPILPSCMTPPGKGMISGNKARALIKKILAVTLKKIEKGAKVRDVVTSEKAGLISDDVAEPIKHVNDSLFSIFLLSGFDDVSDNGFVCKFEEDTAFLAAVSSADVRYVYSRMNFKKEFQPFTLLTVWKKENGKWRILTVSVATDDD